MAPISSYANMGMGGIWSDTSTTTSTIATTGTTTGGTIYINPASMSGSYIVSGGPDNRVKQVDHDLYTYKGIEIRRHRDYESQRTRWIATYSERTQQKVYHARYEMSDEEMELAGEHVLELVSRRLHRQVAEQIMEDKPVARASQRHRRNPFDVRWLDGPGSLLEKMQRETDHWLEPVRTAMAAA